MGRRLRVSNALSDPFIAVSGAHADAAATLRWAADLGIARGEPESARLGRLVHPRELELLTAISWLPERVAGAARSRQPDRLARYLESLAAAWLDCRVSCPALPFGGRQAPPDEAGMAARLWLADAARTALAAALGLLGIAAPGRI
jgi:arginyl-tRNA synthetase